MDKSPLACILIVFMSLCLSSVDSGFCIAANGTITVPVSSNMPRIDGAWTMSDEWLDASENIIQNGSATLYVRVKGNRTHVFVILDFVTDSSQENHDMGGVGFDPKDNGGIPSYVFAFGGVGGGAVLGGGDVLENGTVAWSFIIGTPRDLIMDGGFSGVNDPYEGDSHRIYEFQMPCSFLGHTNSYGFYAFVYDDSSTETLLEWPVGAGGLLSGHPDQVAPTPSRWGSVRGSFGTFATDINEDFSVDILDISIAGKAFRTEPGDSRWDARADLDRNNIVDIVDLSRIAKDFGKKA